MMDDSQALRLYERIDNLMLELEESKYEEKRAWTEYHSVYAEYALVRDRNDELKALLSCEREEARKTNLLCQSYKRRLENELTRRCKEIANQTGE